MLNGSNVRLPSLHAQFAAGASAEAVVVFCRERGYGRLLLVGSPGCEARYEKLWQSLGNLTAETFFAAEAHCPEATVESCRRAYRQSGCDASVVVGGGSTLGLGKILRAEEKAGFIALPTTYSGSEATAIFGRKIGHEKRTAVDDSCRPELIVYDATLTTSLPERVTITSAMNSIAHAVEALYPKTPDPVAATLARDCLLAHKTGFELLRGPDPETGREQLLYAGLLGGLVIGMTGIALHHQLCHVIGGLFDLPHAESNTVVLPQVIAYNEDYAPLAATTISDVFGGENPGGAIYDFAAAHGGPTSLESIGMPASGIDAVIETMLAHGGYNPRPLEKTALRKLVAGAFAGTRPGR